MSSPHWRQVRESTRRQEARADLLELEHVQHATQSGHAIQACLVGDAYRAQGPKGIAGREPSSHRQSVPTAST